MKYTMGIVVLAVLFVWLASPAGAQSDEQRVHYEPTWESLDKHATPKWFLDAKLGFFIYPVHPTAEDWQRYRKTIKDRGPYTYGGGDPGDAWDKVEWDPDDLAQLAVDMGARYVVYSVDPLSYFLTYPSKYADIEGSQFSYLTGPGAKQRDYIAELAAAVRGRGLKFGLYRNFLHPGNNPYFLESMYEMIDRYHPDTLWLDQDWPNYPASQMRSAELLAYYYNHSPDPAEVACQDSMGRESLATGCRSLIHGDFYRKEMMPPHPEISNGAFERYEPVYRYRERSPVNESEGLVNNMVEWLADAASKNGNLLPAIHLGPKPLFEFKKRTLRQIGMWLEVNGEAIYETRPWYDGSPEDRTTDGIHVRYTTKGDALYAILFRWPRGNKVVFAHLRAADGTKVQMLGQERPMSWQQTDAGLELSKPSRGGSSGYETEVPCDHAFSIRITPQPTWAP